MSTKLSIRFFGDKEVRAAWDEASNRWLFVAADVVGALTNSTNPRIYWAVLKSRLKQQKNELITICKQLKMPAADGKLYLTDCLSQADIVRLVEHIPSKNAVPFVRWLTYSEDSIDGRSKSKAYALWESGLLEQIEVGTTKGLQQIHAYLFDGLYDFAGQIRTKNIAKGGFQFAMAQFLNDTLQNIERMPDNSLDEIIDKYVEMNIAHPFMEGNGRSTRIWLDLLLKSRLQQCVDWSKIDKNAYLDAMARSVADSTDIKRLIASALTTDITNRDVYMKGIDYSYYYEES